MGDPGYAAADDPRRHTANLRNQFTQLIDHVREDVEKIQDPQAKALFETAAEVLIGLRTAFEHFERRAEPAWKSAGAR